MKRSKNLLHCNTIHVFKNVSGFNRIDINSVLILFKQCFFYLYPGCQVQRNNNDPLDPEVVR